MKNMFWALLVGVGGRRNVLGDEAWRYGTMATFTIHSIGMQIQQLSPAWWPAEATTPSPVVRQRNGCSWTKDPMTV